MIVSSLMILGSVAKLVYPGWYITGHVATSAALMGAI